MAADLITGVAASSVISRYPRVGPLTLQEFGWNEFDHSRSFGMIDVVSGSERNDFVSIKRRR
jgi:hypothetical protein